jgi:pimeloyl-ACP methyl ester carboxylesterase
MATSRLTSVIVLLVCTTAICLSASDNSDPRRMGAWETVTQAVRKSNSPSLAEMTVQIPNGGSVRVRYSHLSARSSVVLVMCGTFSKAENPFADDLSRDLMDAGHNVLIIDSFFSTRFVQQSRIGAPGNLRQEALLAGQLLQEFNKKTGNKASEFSVVGVSYGGAVAMQMALLEKENKLPVKLSHVLALSVPASFREAMRLLDEYEDLPYSYDKIVPIVKSAKPGASPVASTPELQKVIGRGFRLDLPNTVLLVDRLYGGQIIPAPAKSLGLENLGNPRAENMDREVEAAAVGFRPFFDAWLAQYWINKHEVASADELLDFGEMSKVLPQLDGKVEYIFARNDPLNIDGAAAELEQTKTAAKVTILPNGGHAGFVRTAQMQQIISRIFAQSVASGPSWSE